MASSADLVLVNARVRTLDPARPSAEAVAVGGGRLLAVGDEAAALALRDGSRTEVIDLGGATLTPGLVDSHIHPFFSELFLGGIDLLDARTLDDVTGAVAAASAGSEPGAWVTGFGVDYGVFAATGIEGSLLAEAAGGRPVVLQLVDLHTAVATPRALELAGVDGPREFGENAEIVCRDGVPTGELREPAAVAAVTAAMPERSAAELYRAARENLARFAAVGLTGLHAMDGDLARLDLLRELEANGHLSARVVTPFWLQPESGPELWAEFAAAAGEHGERWRAGVAKLFVDGVIDAGTAWLFEPDAEGDGLEPFWPDPDRYRRAVATMGAAGLQCVTHAIGDRAVRETLDAYRELPPPRRGRHRVEHVETIQPEDLPRFAAEGVVASMQPQHMMWLEPDGSDNWSRRLGPERAGRGFPTRALVESGAQVTLGSDWPVARFDPREGMAAARLRRPPTHRNREPYDDQALSALEALLGYTAWPAATAGEADLAGSIVVGKRADLTAFAADPVDSPADELPQVPVVLTVVAGEVVHRELA